MKKLLQILTLVLLFVGCTRSTYYLKLPTRYYNHKFVFKLKIPQKFVFTQYHPLTGEASETENSAHLPDGSTIYITDNTGSGSKYKEHKIAKYGDGFGLSNYQLKDTATLYGVYKGKYWKEKKYPTIVVGYYDAPGGQVKSYDKILDGIALQVDSLRKITGVKE